MGVLTNEPQETRGIFFFPGHEWKCVGYTLSKLACFHQSFFLLSGIFVLLRRTQGWTKPESSLIWPFLCCISIYWSFILMFGDALKKKKKSGCLMNKIEWLSRWPFFFHRSIWLSCSFLHQRGSLKPLCCSGLKTFQLILNNDVQTSLPRLSLEEEELTCKTMETL